jgi:hypothetical protein
MSDWSYRPLKGCKLFYEVLDENRRVVLDHIFLGEAKRLVDRVNAKGKLPNERCARIDGVRYYNYDRIWDVSESPQERRDRQSRRRG